MTDIEQISDEDRLTIIPQDTADVQTDSTWSNPTPSGTPPVPGEQSDDFDSSCGQVGKLVPLHLHKLATYMYTYVVTVRIAIVAKCHMYI